MSLLRISVVAALAYGVALAGCSDSGAKALPRIVVSPSTLVFNSVALGQEDILEIIVENTGESTLRVSEVRVSTDTGFVQLREEDPSSFELEPNQEQFLQFVYRPTAPESTDGNIVFVTNDPQNASLTVPIDTPRPTPAPAVIPAILDFGIVGVNTEGEIAVELRNIGLAPLIICNMIVTGNPEITSDVEEIIADIIEPDVGYAVVDLFDISTGVGVNSLPFTIFYTPLAPGDDQASLVIEYDSVGDVNNACQVGNTTQVDYDVNGTAGTPLLGREPCPLDFRERAVDVGHEETVTLTNLGILPLEIFDIRLDQARTASTFAMGDVPELPVVLDPEDNSVFSVSYRPTELSAEAGVVLIEHTDVSGDRITSECRIAGVGVENDCPVSAPVGWILEDSENRRGTDIDWALPLQTLVLDGTDSYDPAGDAIVDYFWEVVEAPDRAINSIREFSGDRTNPALAEYFLPLAGRYRICLSVVDSSGLECESSCITIVAIPEEAIAIELTWDNPLDPDQSDAEGADVDLHFVKMPAAWFDPTFDAYYGNDQPTWNPEHPSLDIDDTDGVGPETIQLDDPEECQWYAVGAHYFREAYGTAWPTVRIFINGRLVDEIVNQPLFETDYFWDIARIHWPSGEIRRVNTVIESFDSSEGFAPPVTDAMRESGLCGLDE